MGTWPTTGAASDENRRPWLEAAARALKGADLGALASETLEGVTIQPLYDAASAPSAQGPLVRASGADGWDIRAEIAAADPAEGNRVALEALSGGCASLLVRTAGAAGTRDGLARVLEGVVIEAAPVALDAGFAGAEAASWLADIAKDAPAARLGFHLDPLGAFAAAGESPGPIEAHLARAAAVAAELAGPYPEATLFLASARAVHEAGGSAAQELGAMVAAAVAYARALAEAGLRVPEAFGRIVLGLSVDADYLIGITKLRAARAIWGRLAAACGAEAPARIEARSSRRMLTAVDPWTNLLRLTVAGFAAAAGGADAIVLGSFTDALGRPAERARRLARNTQLILMQEAGLGRVEDPAAGAVAFEALTLQLARQGWMCFQAIESQGGLATALSSGFVAQTVGETRKAREGAAADDRTPVLGVTRFPDPAPIPVEVEPEAHAPAASMRLPGPDSRCPPLSPMRLSETAERIAEDLQP